MVKQKGICEECKSEYEYEYNPKYPRKYCPVCSAKKKAEYEMAQTDAKAEVVKPGITQPQASVGVIGATEGIHKVMHEFQSQYEFGPASNRHTIKYRTIDELKEAMRVLTEAGLMNGE